MATIMVGEKVRGKEIRTFIVNHVRTTPLSLNSAVVDKFNISRQSASYHINRCCDEGLISAHQAYDDNRRKSYQLIREQKYSGWFENSGLEEHLIWTEHVKPHISDLPENVRYILYYGFTEMFNNAIDHSESQKIHVHLERSSVDTALQVYDQGEGIFRRICRLKKFTDEKESIFELAKGKLTTDPDNHTGEGIFFSSRMFDGFVIVSHEQYFAPGSDGDVLLEYGVDMSGTRVTMKIANNSNTQAEEVFQEYADPDSDPSFNKTVFPIYLADYAGDGLISRSQAKRVLNGCQKFKTVVLDFTRVKRIGQAFADEIFRVYVNANPEVTIEYSHAAPQVLGMIKRAQNNTGTR